MAFAVASEPHRDYIIGFQKEATNKPFPPPNKSSTDFATKQKLDWHVWVKQTSTKQKEKDPQIRTTKEKIYVIISFKNDTYVPKKRLECKQRAVAILRYAKTSTFHTEKSWGHLPQSRSGQARSIWLRRSWCVYCVLSSTSRHENEL